MDGSLKQLIERTSQNLLSTSPYFEPYIPSSDRNIFQGLKLLHLLGDIVQEHLNALPQKPVTFTDALPVVSQGPSKLAIPTKPSKQSQDKNLVNALIEQSRTRTGLKKSTIISRPRGSQDL